MPITGKASQRPESDSGTLGPEMPLVEIKLPKESVMKVV